MAIGRDKEAGPQGDGDGLSRMIRRLDKLIKGSVAIAVVLAIAYVFVLKSSAIAKVAFVTAFFISIDCAAIGALLVAAREWRDHGLKTAGAIGTIMFFGSFGLVVLTVTAIIAISCVWR
jgi:hypothetical protein